MFTQTTRRRKPCNPVQPREHHVGGQPSAPDVSNRKNDCQMRIGIDLSPLACRIVSIDDEAWGRARADVRVRAVDYWPSTTTSPFGSPETRGRLAAFRGHSAAVVLWNTRADHRQVVVHDGTYNRMRAEARLHLRDSGALGDGALLDIAPASPCEGGKRSLMTSTAPSAEVAAATAPLVAAGIKIRAVLTPASALQSLARLRTAAAGGAPPPLGACVAVGENASCIALLRNGVLIGVRDVPWGFLDERSGFTAARDRGEIATRLSDEVTRFLPRHVAEPLSHVAVCGGMPELRSMTVQLMEDLDVEVEPLDSLFGINEAALPIDKDEFHDAAAGLRLAWAAAVNPKPALDLLRARRRSATTTYLSRAAVVAGAAAGLGAGWWIDLRLPPPALSAHVVVQVAPVASQMESVARVEPLMAESAAFASFDPPSLARRAIVEPTGALIAAAPPPRLADVGDGTVLASAAPAPDRPWEKVPPLTPRVPLAPAPQLVPVANTTLPIAPLPPPVARVKTAAVAPARVSARSASKRAAEQAAPFSASLETILFGRERSVAIVDGRVVQVGDQVHGAEIVEITASAVMLRDQAGRLRRLTLSER